MREAGDAERGWWRLEEAGGDWRRIREAERVLGEDEEAQRGWGILRETGEAEEPLLVKARQPDHECRNVCEHKNKATH